MLATDDKKAYYNFIQPKFLRWEFIEPYTKLEPKFGELGLVVYYRTYSRYIEELRRRESWWEMILRVVEYSMSLYPLNPEDYTKPGLSWSKSLLNEEARELFDNIFHMKVFCAGRTFWVGGTQVVKAAPESNFNCSFTTINNIKAYVDMFHLLLVGAGVGFSVEKKYIDELPTFNNSIKVVHKDYVGVPKGARAEDTDLCIELVDVDSGSYDKRVVITVGDSKKGWEKALEAFLTGIAEGYTEIKLVYDNVRPAGERLKTMGGRSSGPGPLRKMFEEITDIITNSNGRLTSVQAMDIANCIAKAVVVGGVRRSSQIALGDIFDEEFISAKENLFTDESKAKYRTTRVMSNNSVMLWEKPSKQRLYQIFEKIKTNGEPAFVNAEVASRRRPNFKGGNPCFEILLDNKGVCNLTEVNVRAFVLGPDNFDYLGFKKAIQLATRMGSRITNVTLWDKEWDTIQKRDRLLGVSLTGQVEAWDALGWGYAINDVQQWANKFLRIPFFSSGGKPEQPSYIYTNDKRIENVLAFAKAVAREEADEYHEQMGLGTDHPGIPRSLLVTTVKPSGTLSQLPGVSSGVHRPYAPYYFRNIRVSKNDPVAKALRFLGLPCHPENGQGKDLLDDAQAMWKATVSSPDVGDEEVCASTNYFVELLKKVAHPEIREKLGKTIAILNFYDELPDHRSPMYLDWEDCNTWVFKFPVKTDAPVRAIDERAVDQLHRYKQIMDTYVDHNCSITVSVADHEWEQVVEWLYKDENWNSFVGVSFIKRFDAETAPYPQMPYTSCTKQDYDQAKINMESFTEEKFQALISMFEQQSDEYLLDSDCSGLSFCPVR